MQSIAAKLRSGLGESLVESLIALLVITLAGLMLAGSVVSSARVNAKTKEIVTFPQYSGEESRGSAAVTLSQREALGSGSVSLGEVSVYECEGNVVYYEKNG